MKINTNKSWVTYLFLIFVIILLLVPFIYCVCRSDPTKPEVPVRVDTFYIYRDKIIERIDTITVIKIRIEKEYEHKLEEISHLTDSSSYLFFTDYLSSRFSESKYETDSPSK